MITSKLEFGNVAQIGILRKFQGDARAEEDRQQKLKTGELKTFEVTVDVGGSFTTTVEAKDAKEAERVAKESTDYYDANLEAEYVWVNEKTKI